MPRSYLRPESSQSTGKVSLFNCLTGSSESDRNINHIHNLFRTQVMGPAFPCALAKSAFSEKSLFYRFGLYEDLESSEVAKALSLDLEQFVNEQPNIGAKPSDYSTFLAVFKAPLVRDELHFEESLWRLLCGVHKEDRKRHKWDANTSPSPEDQNFSFSVAGQSFFVVGMNGQSSRVSRRFVYPSIAFNSHHQFEHLRSSGRFENMQTIIRRNDEKIQGNINPSLSNYGDDSEAKQYSGRLVEPDWKCPFP